MIPSVFASSLPIANDQSGQSQGSRSSNQPSTSSAASNTSSAGTSRPSAVGYPASTCVGPSLTVPVTSNPMLDRSAGTYASHTTTAAVSDSTIAPQFGSSSVMWNHHPQGDQSQQWAFAQPSQMPPPPPPLVHSSSDPTAYASAQEGDHTGQQVQSDPDRAASQPLPIFSTQQQPPTQSYGTSTQDSSQGEDSW